MTASSVTGIGPGSAEGSIKGSSRQTLGVNNLIGPRIMAASYDQLDIIGTKQIAIPEVIINSVGTSGSVDDYIVMVNDTTDGSPIVGVLTQLDIFFVDVTGIPMHTFNWILIKIGW